MTTLHTPDRELLRRFGFVRAVGGAGYLAAAVVLWTIFGARAWPLLLGAPVLAVVTTAYFLRSERYPRTAVTASLVADALVLGGATAFVGGTGSGTPAVYAIVIVSAGILLGRSAAAAFTVLCSLLAVLQLISEEMGFTPPFLHRPELDDRVPVLLITLAVLASVGFLTSAYAGRLQEEVAEAGQAAEVVRIKARRRRTFVQSAGAGIREPLSDIEATADVLETTDDLDADARRRLAAALRMRTAELVGEVEQLVDAGELDDERVLQPVELATAVQDCLLELGPRAAHHRVDVDLPAMKVLADRRVVRRIASNLLENAVVHTPHGTTVRVEGHRTGGRGVLVVSDDGPGIPDSVRATLFDPPKGGRPRVGLPLVAELARSVSAEVRVEGSVRGGARFLVGFRLAPSSAPSGDDVVALQQSQQPQR